MVKKLNWLIFLGVFLLTLQPPLDLDLGWHLKYGEYFFQTGQVLKDNLYSFVWPDYKWVQASWGYDLLVYQIYSLFGFIGISLAGAAITLVIFLLLVFPFNRFNFWQLLFLAVVFLSHSKPLYAASLRSQTPSTLLFALVLIITHHKFLGGKAFYLLPILFLIWANLHGGFSLGLILVLIMWLGHGLLLLIKKLSHQVFATVSSKTWLSFGFILSLSFLTPLINPWGLRIYEETFKHSSNINLTVIVEWMPLLSWPIEAAILGIVAALTILVAIIRKQVINLPYLLAFILSAYLALSSLRFVIIFGVMATYFLAQNITEVNLSKLKLPFVKFSLGIFLITLIVTDLLIFKRYFVPFNPFQLPTNWDQLCKLSLDCSEGVTEAMLKNPPKGNGYHPYNYGGYLILRVPQVKTFLDGRMAAWEENGKTPPIIEGDWIILQRNPIAFRKFESEYNFQWAIVPTPTYITEYLDRLVKNNLWERRYRDEFYSYYVKKSP